MAELPLVEAGPGSELLLSLVLVDRSKVSVLLGTAEAVAIGAELLLAALVGPRPLATQSRRRIETMSATIIQFPPPGDPECDHC
jgi:hypothetical protein